MDKAATRKRKDVPGFVDLKAKESVPKEGDVHVQDRDKEEGDTPKEDELADTNLLDAIEAKGQWDKVQLEKQDEVEPVLARIAQREIKKIAKAMQRYLESDQAKHQPFVYKIKGSGEADQGKMLPGTALPKILAILRAKGYLFTWKVDEDGEYLGHFSFEKDAVSKSTKRKRNHQTKKSTGKNSDEEPSEIESDEYDETLFLSRGLSNYYTDKESVHEYDLPNVLITFDFAKM